jgi:hypothetical protein
MTYASKNTSPQADRPSVAVCYTVEVMDTGYGFIIIYDDGTSSDEVATDNCDEVDVSEMAT